MLKVKQSVEEELDFGSEVKPLAVLFERYRHFILYVFIGGFSASLDFLLFNVLNYTTDLNYQYSNFISTHLGILSSFLLNAKFNFKVTDQWRARAMKFYAVGLLGWALSAVALWLMISQGAWPEWLAKGLSLVLVVAFQFTCNKLITFAN